MGFVKLLALLLCSVGLCLAQVREGNFDIRFEPQAKLQTGVSIPFQISVVDALHKPLPDAKVTLQIETTDHKDTKVFQAPATAPGIYLANPVFPAAGQWNVYVEVRRGNQMSARTIEFSVAD
jgi:uncharacterized GH25 family protein